ncbi:lipoprotein insertase outer membrane protein LolB [Salmonella enterica]|uniref:lipoprotein insertase outer membrane protein LolB n=1 Tax=Salmonella enterica TaxID=28901 RepID=UPI00398C6B05
MPGWPLSSSEVLLTNALGSTEVEHSAQPGTSQMADNKTQRHTAHDAEAMVSKLSRMPIPVNSLLPRILELRGDATHDKPDDQHRPRDVHNRQDGQNWHAAYGGDAAE